MIAVSEGWKRTHTQMLLPETFLEISVGISDLGIRDLVVGSGENEAIFSNSQNVPVDSAAGYIPKYATLEHNLWFLNGSRGIVPDSEPYLTPGYASQDDTTSMVVLTLPEVRDVPIPGFTITWSSEFDEYPTDFHVTVLNGDTVVSEVYVTDNTSSITQIDLSVVDYNKVVVETSNWCLPNHRARVDFVAFGHVLIFNKNDILQFEHEQNGDLNSGEISKNSINFTLNNVDGRWNPNNPAGMEKYLSERQLVNVRYGMRVNGETEWVKAGTFYLSEWRAPANGLEASFSARDVFEYLINEPYGGVKSGTLKQIATEAWSLADPPNTPSLIIDESLANYSTTITENYSAAEVIQMCANAAGCIVYQDRFGDLHIEPVTKKITGYAIASDLSYSHPEMSLSKPMRAVSVSYGDELEYVLDVGNTGETQTVDNPFVNSQDQAIFIAEWVRDTLETRKTLSGEFRADPRLDLFDTVSVHSKYGIITPVVITNLVYSYSGSFKATYSGRVVKSQNTNSVLGNMVLGKSVLGEVNW